MEQLTGLTPPPRALYIRVVMAELERLHSHVLWAGIASKLMGFKTMFMTCFALREKSWTCSRRSQGNRVNYSMNRIGGVNRDITDPLAIARRWSSSSSARWFARSSRFLPPAQRRSRCAGIGVLTHERPSPVVLWGHRKSLRTASGSSPRRALRGLLRDGIRCAG
jgi:Ni,Fe-hydrogenase III large subunit